MNWILVAVFLILLLFAWQMVMFPIWQTWAGNRYEEALRAGPKVGNQFAPHRLRETLNVASWPLNATFGLLVFAPITYGVLWCVLPEAVGESELYRVVGMLGATALVVWLSLALILDLVLRVQSIAATLHATPAQTAERPVKALGTLSKLRFYVAVVITFGVAVIVLDIAYVPIEATLVVALVVIAKLLVDGYETLVYRLRKRITRRFPAVVYAIVPLLIATAVGVVEYLHGIRPWMSVAFGAMAGWLALVVVNLMLR